VVPGAADCAVSETAGYQRKVPAIGSDAGIAPARKENLDTKLAGRLKTIVAAELADIRRLRHELHRRPGLAFQEHEARRLVAESLAGLDLAVWPPLMQTDFIAELRAAEVGRTICFRADMDALPIDEETSVPHSSQVPDVTHACGHDGHMAALVGAARALTTLREHLGVNVRFVFQPGEEAVAGGRTLVDLGCCRDVEAAYALHGWPGLPVGQIGSRPGALFAAAGFFRVEFVGKGCHGSAPQQGANPIPVAADAIRRLEHLHERVNRADGSVVSVCTVSAGNASNIIPDAAVIEGTVRYLSDKHGRQIEQGLRLAIDAASGQTGVRADLQLVSNYPPLVNSPESVDLVRSLAREHLPAGAWEDHPHPEMVAEDFANDLRGRVGAMCFVGLGEDSPPLHSSRFDFNDDALENAILMLCLIALNS